MNEQEKEYAEVLAAYSKHMKKYIPLEEVEAMYQDGYQKGRITSYANSVLRLIGFDITQQEPNDWWQAGFKNGYESRLGRKG